MAAIAPGNVEVAAILTLSSAADAAVYEPGMWVRLIPRPRRWWVRLWRRATRYEKRYPFEGAYRVVWVEGNQVAVRPAERP